MIDVHAHPKRMVFRQHRAQLGRDPLRKENRDAGADADEFDVRDRAETFEDAFQFVVAEKQRVAAGKKNVTDFSVLFEIVEDLLKIGVQFLFADPADDPAPRAITAVARAAVGDEKQDAVRITMDQSRHRHVRIFAARIDHVVRRRPGLFDPRNDLAPDRVVGPAIAGTREEIEEMRSNGEGELVARQQHAAPFFIREFEVLLELGQRSDPVLELPFPVVPEFRRGARPVTRRERNELFSILFSLGKSEHS